MKAKRVMALVLSAVLTVGSLDTACLPVLAAGEEQTVTAAEDEVAVSADEAASDEQKETSEADEAGKKETDEASKEAAADEDESSETADDTAGVDISEYLTVNDKGEITKYSYEGEDITDLIIPSTVKGITVKKIGDGVFKDRTEIISVKFPSTLEVIGNNAFAGSSMGSNQRDGKLVIPAGVTEIGYSAFNGCKALKEVVFEEGEGSIVFVERYGSYGGTFASCEALTTITFSNRISDVPATFADDCKALTTVNWSATVKSIGNEAFKGDVLLDSTDLSNTVVERIGDSAFSGCTGFGLVKLPETLKTIGNYAFMNTLMGKRTTHGHLVIPASVDVIGFYAFKECVYLENVTFDNSKDSEPKAIEFGERYGSDGQTFYGCKELKSITLSNRSTVIPKKFAMDCPALEKVVWSKELKSIDNSAFENDVKLNSPDFSATLLERVESNAFCSCSALDIVKFPETLKHIGDNAFYHTPMGTETAAGDLVIPAAVEYIGYYAFRGCSYLQSVTFKDYTGDVALDPISFGERYGSDGYTFAECPVLKSIVISNRIGYIPKQFAMSCPSLTSVKWSKTTSSIGRSAFYGDDRLNSPDFSGTALESIEDSAFEGCASFGLAKFPAGLKSIGNNAFNGTAMGNKDSSGVLVISEKVSYIGYNAFRNCAYLGRVIIEDYSGDGALPVLEIVSRYGSDAFNFADCPELEEIIISDRVELIPYGFAYNCPKLTAITIPDGVGEIKQGAFFVKMDNGKLLKTDVTGESDVVKNYDWAKDNRERGKITKISVTGVTLDRSELELSVGRSATLKATVNPSDATNKSVFWGSSDTNIVSVDNGKVKALAVGEAVITVTTTDGGFKATCNVKVVEGSSPIGGDEDEEEITLPGKKNVPVTAYVRFIPNGADEDQIYYTPNKSGKKLKLNSKFTKKGYSFKGWYCTYIDKKGKEKTKKLKTITAATLQKYAVDGTVTLEAKFAVNTYKITFEKSAKFEGKKVKVSGKIPTQKRVYSEDGETVTSIKMMGSDLILKDASLELKGWTTVKKGTEVMFAVGEEVSLDELLPAKGKTIKLYAVYGRK